MTAPIRVAVVGGTFARGAVAPAYDRHPSFAVTTVVSARDEAGVARAVTRPDVDLVSVHAAPARHRAVVDQAMDAGRHVVCDKPFGVDLADAEHMAARARRHTGVALTTFQLRYEPWRRAVRDLLAAGALGPLAAVDWVEHHGVWRGRSDGWQFSRAAGGGWMGAMASHTVDTVSWWGGPARVRAAVLDGAGPDGAERSCALVLALGPADATVVARSTSSVTTGPRVVVAGADAAVERAADGSLVGHGVAVPPVAALSFPELLDAWCGDVARAVAGDPPPDLPTFADGLAWARLRDEALRAAADRPTKDR